MLFYLFERPPNAHIRKSREYLEEANLRRVEHQAAAEHHGALAEMYAGRVARIEAEIAETLQAHSGNGLPMEEAGIESVRLKTDSVVNYPSRASLA